MRKSFFLGAVAALLALLWAFVLAPQLTRFPTNLFYYSDVLSTDNFYDEARGEFTGPVSSLTKFSFEAAHLDGPDLVVRNLFNVRTLSGEKVFEVERLYAIDPLTGMHVPGKGDHDRRGYLFAPKHLQAGQGFTYWHVNYDAPALMQFKGVEDLNGLTVHKYEAVLNADQTDSLGHLPGVPEARGVNLDVRLVAWFEPISGHLVKYEDYSTAYYYDIKTGERLHPWNEFHNEYSQESIHAHTVLATQDRNNVLFYEVVLPLMLALLAFALLALPYLNRQASDSFESSLERVMGISVLPWIVLIFSLLLTILAWQAVSESAKEKALLEFDLKTNDVETSLVQRMSSYEQVVVGAKAFVTSSNEVTREEWREYVQSSNLSERLPGFKVIAYSPFIEGEDEKNELIERVRVDFPEFAVTPEGSRSEYLPLIYLEPLGGNLDVLGYDVLSEDMRRAAIERARDTGRATITGKVVLVQDLGSERPGVIMYAPVYESSSSMNSFKGVASMAFRTEDLLNDVLAGKSHSFNFRLFDASQREENLLYESTHLIEETDFSRTSLFTVAGRDWILVSYAEPGFIESTQLFPPYYIALLGVLLSFLSFYLFYSYFNNVSVRVKSLTRAIEELSHGKLDVKIDEDALNAQDDVGRLARAFNRTMVSLKLAMKATAPELKKELVMERARSSEHETSLMKRLENVNKALNKSSLVSITDKEGFITYANDKFLEVSKYSKDELIGENHRILKSGFKGEDFHTPQFYLDLWAEISSGRVWTGDLRNKAKDGSTYWVRSTLMPLFGEKGKVSGYVAVRTPITDQMSDLETAIVSIEKGKAVSKEVRERVNSFRTGSYNRFDWFREGKPAK